MTLRSFFLGTVLAVSALPALADEVNVYSHRQPELIQPLMDAFTAETGITVNVASSTRVWWSGCKAKVTAAPPMWS